MLRLILSWFQSHNLPRHILQFQDGATWYSEAFLPTPFKPRSRVDPRGETRTHADAVVGHFDIERAPRADKMLLPQATQLIVAEAKINSPLSSRTSHAPKFDQAARNVACIAELLRIVNRHPSKIQALAFVVIAPQEHILEITAKLKVTSIESAVRSRVKDFSPERDVWLIEWFLPTLETIRIEPLTWEQLIRDIASVDEHTSQGLAMFYERCLKYNKARTGLMPA